MPGMIGPPIPMIPSLSTPRGKTPRRSPRSPETPRGSEGSGLSVGSNDEELLNLQDRLSDHLFAQQRVMLAILRQAKNTAREVQALQMATLENFAALREDIGDLEASIPDKLRVAAKAWDGRDDAAKSEPPSQRLTSDADDEPANPAEPEPDRSYAQGPLPTLRSETSSAPFSPPRVPDVSGSPREGGLALADEEPAVAAMPSNVEDHAFYLNHDFHCGGISIDEKPTKAEMDFMHGEQVDKPAHAWVVHCFGHKYLVVTLLEWFSLILVCLNSIFTAFQADVAMSHLVHGDTKPKWVQAVDVTFTIIFAVDFVLRWFLWGHVFFTGADKVWNAIDMVCVVSSLLDTVVIFLDMSFSRIVRLFRIVRVLRAVRGLRAIRDLRLLMASIRASMASFFWGFTLLGFVIFIFDIALMQSLVVAAESFGGTLTQDIYDHYGTAWTSGTTLFKAISGGQDWNDLVNPLRTVSEAYVYCYMIYISVVVFGLMNILTAIFCEQASQIAKVDPGLVIEDEIHRNSDDCEQLKEFFQYADVDQDGMVDLNELDRFFKAPERRAMLNLLDVDVAEARALFDLLDVERTGSVNIHDYIDALLRLKGAAKGCDTAMLLVEHKRLMLRLTCFMCYTNDTFRLLFKELKLGHVCQSIDRYISPSFLAKRDAEARNVLRAQLCTHLGTKASDITIHEHVSLTRALSKSMIGHHGHASEKAKSTENDEA